MKVIAWVHPRKGDDYEVELSFDGAVDDSTIRYNLKHIGCTITTDYRVIS